MKVPDKIYVREYPEWISRIWNPTKADETYAINQHEYIRKDALLKLLEGYSHPMTKLIVQEIIDKINSL